MSSPISSEGPSAREPIAQASWKVSGLDEGFARELRAELNRRFAASQAPWVAEFQPTSSKSAEIIISVRGRANPPPMGFEVPRLEREAGERAPELAIRLIQLLPHPHPREDALNTASSTEGLWCDPL